MSFDDHEAAHARDLEERRQAKIKARQFRSDVQEVFGTAQARRLLYAFMQGAGAEGSPLRHDSLTTGHAIGWQDATRWWLDALRTHCPEKEVQMRAEAKREATQGASQDHDDD